MTTTERKTKAAIVAATAVLVGLNLGVLAIAVTQDEKPKEDPNAQWAISNNSYAECQELETGTDRAACLKYATGKVGDRNVPNVWIPMSGNEPGKDGVLPQTKVELVTSENWYGKNPNHFSEVRINGRSCVIYGDEDNGGSITCDWGQK